jgi:hypothetical protein
VHVRPLERRAGGQRRPAKLRAHTAAVSICDADAESGLVLTCSDDATMRLWRSAAAMCSLGEEASLGVCSNDNPAFAAWILPQAHLGAFEVL